GPERPRPFPGEAVEAGPSPAAVTPAVGEHLPLESRRRCPRHETPESRDPKVRADVAKNLLQKFLGVRVECKEWTAELAAPGRAVPETRPPCLKGSPSDPQLAGVRRPRPSGLSQAAGGLDGVPPGPRGRILRVFFSLRRVQGSTSAISSRTW